MRKFPIFAGLLIRSVPILLAGWAAPTFASPALPWTDADQMILVIPADWNSSHAMLHRFQRDSRGWRVQAEAVPVVIGRAGSAWGIGLHPTQRGLQKAEGDGRSPAGVFELGVAFGYADSAPTALRYDAMDSDDYCVDVSGSTLYNRIVNARDAGRDAIAGSTEPMRRDLHADGDQRYRLGFVIDHNPRAVAGAGSCIFAHLWKSADSSTAGCTAMDDDAMRTLLAWLQPSRHPVFVLLPQHEYERLQSPWHLPRLNRH